MANLLPLSTAICERGFGKMKIIKNDRRSCLGEEILDHLMRVSIEYMAPSDVDFVELYSNWKCRKTRFFIYVMNNLYFINLLFYHCFSL